MPKKKAQPLSFSFRREKEKTKEKSAPDKLQAQSISYQTLLELLLTPSGDFESCKVLLTDTIFFGDDGKATVYLKTDRDGRVTSSQLKLTIQDLRMRIPDIVKVKRQEVRSILSALLMMQNEEIAAANRGSNQS